MLNLNAFKQFLVNKYSGTETKSLKLSTKKPLNSNTGWQPSLKIQGYIRNKEGSSMYSPAPDTGKVNRSFQAEANSFWSVNTPQTRKFLLLNRNLADALFSYSYNVGSYNYLKRVVPVLTAYINGLATERDIEMAMWGNNDFYLNSPKYSRGLTTRRNEERAKVHEALTGSSKGAFSSRYDLDYRGTRPKTNPISNYLSLTVGTSSEPVYISTPDIEDVSLYSSNPVKQLSLEDIFLEDDSLQKNSDLLDFYNLTDDYDSAYNPNDYLYPLIYASEVLMPLLYSASDFYKMFYDRIVGTEPLQNYLEDYYALYGEPVSPYQGLDDINFGLSINNVAALGGLLYDSITNTYNPNNKLGNFIGTKGLPSVRY